MEKPSFQKIKNINRDRIESIDRIEADYKRGGKIDTPKIPFVTNVDSKRAMSIADAYEVMPNNINDPVVRKAYQALADETIAQYKAMKSSGFDILPIIDDPYKNSKDMIEDVRKNKKIKFFLTDPRDFDPSHPLIQPAGININGYDLTVNDVFRAVHDFFGHAKDGNKFHALGEENAWRAHSSMFSLDARKALTTETRGQNSWVNFGPQMRGGNGQLLKEGDKGFLPANKRDFAQQKAGILPDEFIFFD